MPFLVLIALCASLFIPALATAQSESSAVNDSIAGRPVSYVLRPGDVVRLRIWREPDLSGDFPVDELGRINLPLVGTYNVANETRESLHQKLLTAYRASVQNLSMDVIFLRRIAVVGAVRTPGLYPVDPTMTVADAIALAGGSTLDAANTTVTLTRSGKVQIKNVDPAALVSSLATRPGDQLYVPPAGGFFSRNPWAAGTLIQSLVTVVVAIVTISTR
jgi:polysaccharide export outer membrane protein